MTLIALVVGIALAFAFLVWTRSQPDGGRRVYTIGLVVTALIYLVFALVGRASGRSLGLEALGVLLYGAAAWLGFRRSAALLALGWAMHVVWDVALHLQGAGAAYTPDWYPWGCVSFDLMVAGAVLTAGGGNGFPHAGITRLRVPRIPQCAERNQGGARSFLTPA
jgi:hypothetical protein